MPKQFVTTILIGQGRRQHPFMPNQFVTTISIGQGRRQHPFMPKQFVTTILIGQGRRQHPFMPKQFVATNLIGQCILICTNRNFTTTSHNARISRHHSDVYLDHVSMNSPDVVS
jgi:hypothetical protein